MENEFSDAFVFENKVGIHTFELTCELTKEEWEHLARKKAETSKAPLGTFSPLCPGMRFRLLDEPRKAVVVIVDLRLLRDTSDDPNAYYGITKYGDRYLKTALKNFDALWSDLIGRTINDFRLSRVDLCYNIAFPNGDASTVSKYIALLRRTPWKGRFTLQDLPDIRQAPYSFKISNGAFSLAVYDKIFQQKHCYGNQMPPCPAMMRVELQWERRAIAQEDDFPTTKKLLRHFLRQTPCLMWKQISRVACSQPYVRQEELECLIANRYPSSVCRQRMLRFARILQQSPDAAEGLRQMEEELAQSGGNVQKMMERLYSAYYELGVAPVSQDLTPQALYSLPQITAAACQPQKWIPAKG